MTAAARRSPAAPASAPAGPVRLTPAARAVLRPLPLGSVRLTGGVWARRQQMGRDVLLPDAERWLEAAGNLDNLRLVAAGQPGHHRGRRFSDSDVYKWLEALAWDLARDPDPGLVAKLATTVDLVGRAQADDGYINSYYADPARGGRFRDLEHGHELYCAGHLIQAGIACARAVGDDGLLRIATRFARLLLGQFGPGGPLAGKVPGHPELETALVELYRETSDPAYLDLGCRLIEGRGHRTLASGALGPAYFQDAVPVRQSSAVVGHAVRALYLAAGVTDAYLETGAPAYLEALRRQWADLTTKTYLTGGVGSRHEGEAFGEPYELPPDRAYCETCASVAAVMWGWRMLLATGDHCLADHVERVLHNAFAAGVALDGRSFAYVNPLQVRSGHRDDPEEPDPPFRRSWFDCACCPPNLMRLLASLGEYVATLSDAGLQIHQYMAASIALEHPRSGAVELEVATGYPWRGGVTVTVVRPGTSQWELGLRVPGWCRAARYRVAGESGWGEAPARAYLRLDRRWSPGDRVELELDMAPRFAVPHPRLDAVRGCVAVERGPLVYCFEEPDLPPGVSLDDVALDPSGPLRPGPGPLWEEGAPVPAGWEEVLVIHGAGQAREDDTWSGWPYRSVSPSPPCRSAGPGSEPRPEGTPVPLVAIPYCCWGNRGPYPMRVWLPAGGLGA